MSEVLMFEEVVPHSHAAVELTLTLPFEKRQKSRFRARLNNGSDAGIAIERGSVLRGGDCLKSKDGQVVRIISAKEDVSTIQCNNAHDLARAAYHLGNRHVALQVGDSWIRYLKDHVLDEMVQGFGLKVQHESAAFEPEVGAYHGGHAHNTHSHTHDSNDHEHHG